MAPGGARLAPSGSFLAPSGSTRATKLARKFNGSSGWIHLQIEYRIQHSLVEIKYGQKVLNPEMDPIVRFWNEDGHEIDKVLVI